ncbi:MAG: DNA polymerase III subunit delta [Magnetococcus sp. DMHC-6]
MKLKSQEVPSLLQKSGPPPAALLYGQEQGIIRELTTLFTKTVLKNSQDNADFDVETFFGADLQEERFLTACQSPPFMGEKRLIILREAEKLDLHTQKSVLGYLDHFSPSTVFLAIAGPLESQHLLRKKFENSPSAWCVPFYTLEGNQLGNWLKSQLAQSGFSIAPPAVALLCQRLEGNSEAAFQELEKLKLFMGEQRKISLQEVLAVVGETMILNPFTLADSVTEGQAQQAITLLQKLLEADEEPLALLAILAQRLRRLAKGQQLLDKREEQKKIAIILKIFWKEESTFFNQCRRLSPARLADGLLECLEADKELKGGLLPAWMVMERLVIRLCFLLQRQPT